jgi:hypothetical protein
MIATTIIGVTIICILLYGVKIIHRDNYNLTKENYELKKKIRENGKL